MQPAPFRLMATFALGMACCAGRLLAAPSAAEAGYFDELPVVLTVSHLAQPISDTPGAITVLDRETIRLSGARDVADLLRLVPGFVVSGENGGDRLSPTYHAPLEKFASRNLVLIDGRSVYSSFYVGDTRRGMMSVLLEDIERIEVLRGANSAAYGANAMFGVINIVTRHSADSVGAEAGVTVGDHGVRGSYVRWGGGDPDGGTYRLSAGSRQDDGFTDTFDSTLMQQAHFRGDWRLAPDQELLVESGAEQLRAGRGIVGNIGDPAHTYNWSDWYLRAVWKYQLNDDETLQLAADFDEEDTTDAVPYDNTGVLLDFGGRGRRYNLELQHERRLNDAVRWVWGLGFKQEEAVSAALYNTADAVKISENRVFGNLEWRFTPRWLLNAGWFVGQHSRTGTYHAPRVMANFQLTPDHTLRAGVTRAVRTPTLFELDGDIRYYRQGYLVGNTYLTRGGVQPETLSSQELGYFGNFRDQRLTVDVRVYHERMKDMVLRDRYPLPYTPPSNPWSGWATGGTVYDWQNVPGVTSTGVEYQWRWSPLLGTEFWLNQNWGRYVWHDVSGVQNKAPHHASTVAWFQKLPGQWQFALMWHAVGSMPTDHAQSTVEGTHRLDVRVAYPFRVGASRAEVALTAQSVNGTQKEFLTNGEKSLEPHSYVTLRVEY